MTVCRHCRARLVLRRLGNRTRYADVDTGSFFCGRARHHQPERGWRWRVFLAANRIQRRWFT